MKTRTAIAALALLLAAGVSHAALAQDSTDNRSHRSRGEHQGGGPRQGLEQRGRHTPPPAVATQPETARAPAQAPAQAQAQVSRGEGLRGGQSSPERRQLQAPRSDGVRGGGPQARGPDRGRNDGDSRFGGRHDGRHDGPPQRSDGRWDRRGDRGHDRWERGRLPPVYQSDRRFRISPYRYPQGYFARSWGFGDFLPRGWFGPDYLLSDFYAYGLPYPPPGYEWVRVGADALMVDRYTGRVVQVVRYVFW